MVAQWASEVLGEWLGSKSQEVREPFFSLHYNFQTDTHIPLIHLRSSFRVPSTTEHTHFHEISSLSSDPYTFTKFSAHVIFLIISQV